MPAKLTAIVPQRQFELCRDRIAQILLLEIGNQFTEYDVPELAGIDKIWVDRFVPFTDSEKPAINVGLLTGDYDNESPVSSDGTYNFAIDVFTKSVETDDSSADTLSGNALDRIVGIVWAIMKFPEYSTLDFDTPSISHTTITGFQKGQANPEDASSGKAARIMFQVRVQEEVELGGAIPVTSHYTTAILKGTDKGHLWIWEKDVTYLITESEKFIVSESGNARFIKEN